VELQVNGTVVLGVAGDHTPIDRVLNRFPHQTGPDCPHRIPQATTPESESPGVPATLDSGPGACRLSETIRSWGIVCIWLMSESACREKCFRVVKGAVRQYRRARSFGVD